MSNSNLEFIPDPADYMEAPVGEQLSCLVRIEQQYGQQVIKPVCDVANEFAKISGTKVLTRQTIESMKRLGYRIDVEQTLPSTL